MMSKISYNKLCELKMQKHKRKQTLLEEYNQYATNRPSRHQSHVKDDQSLSYIDLLNEKDLESRQSVEGDGPPAEDCVIVNMTEPDLCFQVVDASDQSDDEAPKQIVSQLQTLKNETCEDQENKGTSSRNSLEMKVKFEMLNLNLNEHQ